MVQQRLKQVACRLVEQCHVYLGAAEPQDELPLWDEAFEETLDRSERYMQFGTFDDDFTATWLGEDGGFEEASGVDGGAYGDAYYE